MLRDDVVFAVEGEQYRWRDVLLAAVRWRDWSAVERRTREGAAAAQHAAASGASLPPDALDDAGREFRYDRDLLTASSMEAWLERWDLSVRDWTAHFSRDLHRKLFPRELPELVNRYPLSTDETARLTLVDAICSGSLGRWKKKLAARAAVQAAMRGTSAGEEQQSKVGPKISTPLLEVLGIDDHAAQEIATRLQRIDSAFESFRSTQLTERALQEHIGNRQLEWMRFDCRVMAFPDEGMAAEAALLLTEDNEGFTGVYSAAHAEPRAAQFFLDEMDAALRDRFIGARPGDLIGPLRLKDEYALYLVMQKSLPSVQDPEVRRRAEDGVLKSLLDRQVTNRVRWQQAGTA